MSAESEPEWEIINLRDSRSVKLTTDECKVLLMGIQNLKQTMQEGADEACKMGVHVDFSQEIKELSDLASKIDIF